MARKIDPSAVFGSGEPPTPEAFAETIGQARGLLREWERTLSPRKARVCTECRRRHFGDLEWVCPEHPTKTEDQPDNPYNGVLPQLA